MSAPAGAGGPPPGMGGPPGAGMGGPPGGPPAGMPKVAACDRTPAQQAGFEFQIKEMARLGIYIPPGYGTCGYVMDWKGNVHIPIHITLVILATLAIIARVYTRAFVVKNFGWDDNLMVIAWVISTSMGILAVWTLKYTGVGYHMIDSKEINPKAPVVGPQAGYAYTIIHVVAIMFVKLSILVFLGRVLTSYKTKWAVRFLFVLALLHGLVSIGLFIFPCWPIRDFWMTSGGLDSRDAHCIPKLPLHLSLNIINAVIDGFILILPIPTIIRSQMRVKEKVAVLSVFVIGSGACIASFYRPSVIPGYAGDADPTWYGADLMITGQIEAALGCICGSSPAFKKLLVHTLPKAFNNIFSRDSSNGGSTGASGSYKLENIKVVGDSKIRSLKGSQSESTEEFRFEGDKLPTSGKYEGTYNNTVVIQSTRTRSTESSDSLDADNHINVTREYEQTSRRVREPAISMV
ncbi:hypothetical protein BJ508DRAFT_139525 [Ascobolus immersus RN42]|uniref:Rhodopsin domain-containing protein n=1 Tax=Ascobolus immersus RN42 TaxID=1160509 RepID=A0A3N4I2L8_ASCIM|nr:hypothetical protein BJ508DRAFT_139525 [Ascobolus immersus RN42]